MATYSFALNQVVTLTATRAINSTGTTTSSTYTVPAGKIALLNMLGYLTGIDSGSPSCVFSIFIKLPLAGLGTQKPLTSSGSIGQNDSGFVLIENSNQIPLTNMYFSEGTEITVRSQIVTPGTGSSSANASSYAYVMEFNA